MKTLRYIPLLLLFVGSLLPLEAAYAQNGDLGRAQILLDERRYTEALSFLDTYIAENPNSVQAYIYRAQAKVAEKDFAGALRDYERAAALDPSNLDAQDGLESVRATFDRTQDGRLQSYRQQVASNPDDPQYRLQLADALYENAGNNASRYREAAAQYEAFLSRTQPNPQVVVRYLFSINGYGDHAEGEQAAKRYLQQFPQDDDIWVRLGYFQYYQRKFDEAITSFQQALRYNPGSSDAQTGLANAQNPPPEPESQYPIDLLMRDLEGRESDSAYDDDRLELARLLAEENRMWEADAQLQILASRQANNPAYQRLRRQVVLPQAVSNFPIDVLQRQLRRTPNDDEKRFELVNEFIKYDRYGEAWEQLTEYLANYQETERWKDLLLTIDEGFMRERGESPIFRIDVLQIRLERAPNNRQVRWSLIDEFIGAGRYAEAYDLAQDERYIDRQSTEYQSRISIIEDGRRSFLNVRLQEVSARYYSNPNDMAAARELVELYNATGSPESSFEILDRLLQASPTDDTLRFQYAQQLYWAGNNDAALNQINLLLRKQPYDPQYRRLYALVSIALGDYSDPNIEQTLRELMLENPNDPAMLLNLAVITTLRGNPAEAEDLLARARGMINSGTYTGRELDDLRQFEHSVQERLNAEEALVAYRDAQGLFKEGQALYTEAELVDSNPSLPYADQLLEQAIQRYEDYMNLAQERPPFVLRDVAAAYARIGNKRKAIGILESLRNASDANQILMEAARLRAQIQDWGGAIYTLEEVLRYDADNYEALLLMGDIQRDTKRYKEAMTYYERALLVAENDGDTERRRVVREHITVLENAVSSGGNNLAAVLSPIADFVSGRGGDTEFRRWSPTTQAQITLPFDGVIWGGLRSHFIEGSRFSTVPQNLLNPVITERVNEIGFGGYYDLTPQAFSVEAPYTNRISGEFGLFDYEGGRSAPFYTVRYWHQKPRMWRFNIGLTSTEGAVAMWAPAGPEQELRLSQLDGSLELGVNRKYTLFTRATYNVVVDRNDTNRGLTFIFEPGRRIFANTYVGINYTFLGYEQNVNFYYSPQTLSSYDGWIQYERDVTGQAYFRMRLALGVIGPGSDFISSRFDLNWIRRFSESFSMNLRMTSSRTSRRTSSTSVFDRYTIFSFTTGLYWTF